MENLKPGDVVTINNNGVVQRLRVTEAEARADGYRGYRVEPEEVFVMKNSVVTQSARSVGKSAVTEIMAKAMSMGLITKQSALEMSGMNPETTVEMDEALFDQLRLAALNAGLDMDVLTEALNPRDDMAGQQALPGLEPISDEEIDAKLNEWNDILGDGDR